MEVEQLAIWGVWKLPLESLYLNIPKVSNAGIWKHNYYHSQG
jgi:hypothetical protein